MASWPNVRDEELALAVELVAARPGDLVLDVPAGGGYLAARFPAGVEVIGVDASVAFTVAGRRRSLLAVRAEAGMLPFGEATIDVVVSLAGVHHEEDLGLLLSEWRRVLVDGGRLVLIDVAIASAEARFLDGFVARWNGVGHRGRYLGDEVSELVSAAGFDVTAEADVRYHWWADDLSELIGFCTTLFGLRGVDPAGVGEVISDVLGVDHDPDGRVGLRWGLRSVVATAR